MDVVVFRSIMDTVVLLVLFPWTRMQQLLLMLLYVLVLLLMLSLFLHLQNEK
jgi:hypothetical protein